MENLDFVSFSFSEAGWIRRGWVLDEYDEWEAHITDARWQSA